MSRPDLTQDHTDLTALVFALVTTSRETSRNLTAQTPRLSHVFPPLFKRGEREEAGGGQDQIPRPKDDLQMKDLRQTMTATLTAPPPAAPVRCNHCGRPLHDVASRLLRAGPRCRAGVPEAELVANLQGAAA
jgi:hypothetical protein